MPTDQPSSVDEKDGVEESMLRLSDSEGDVRSIACGGLVQPAARRSSYSPQQTLPAPPPRREMLRVAFLGTAEVFIVPASRNLERALALARDPLSRSLSHARRTAHHKVCQRLHHILSAIIVGRLSIMRSATTPSQTPV